MIAKIVLLLISIGSLLTAGAVKFIGDEKEIVFVKIVILTFISFVSLTVFFIKSKKLQDFLEKERVNKIIIILFSIGIISFLAISFFLHNKDGNYVADITLDSVSYFTQAKIFLTGHLNVPSPKLKDFFTTGYCINDGKYYSKYFPGWPLILAGGLSLGIPWIINPIFGFLTLLVVYLIGLEIYDRDTGLFAAVLLLFSYLFYFFTPSYLSEPTVLFFSSFFFYLMIKTLKEPKTVTSLSAGFCLGIIFLIRPLSAFAVSLPIMSYFLYTSIFDKKKNTIHFGITVIAFLPALFLLLTYNYYQTGSIFLTPFQYYNPFDSLGFGLRSPDIFIEPKSYTFLDALKNLVLNLALLNLESVLFLFLFLSFVIINKKNKWDVLLLATIFSVVFIHMFYFFRNTRYYYAAFFGIFLLASRGINLSDIVFKKYLPNIPVKNLNYFILLFIVMANIFITFSPQKILNRIGMIEQLRDPFSIVKNRNLTNSVIFLKSVPEKYNNISYYVQNPLNFDGEVLFVRNLGERNIELMEYYPEKKFYMYEFDRKERLGKLTVLK
jgi:hypothetical protein